MALARFQWEERIPVHRLCPLVGVDVFFLFLSLLLFHLPAVSPDCAVTTRTTSNTAGTAMNCVIALTPLFLSLPLLNG